ncbi:hypothetical protein WH47_08450 [Habropoda laboriosa]|uniref:Uncharacterized protein n=1 Tax=Habropoda laboriosa TaxID=597456 RepID=A0A0L7QP81_9HYME|nr:hypothetical protein WH47_08450 [Habropoda laboriosa]
MLVRHFSVKNSTKLLPQAPHSPNQAPCNFFLFSPIETPSTGTSLQIDRGDKGKFAERVKSRARN